MDLHPWLQLHLEATISSLSERIRDAVFSRLSRRGAVVALSGGIDSSVCAALCALGLGTEKVFGLLLPEKDSSPDSVALGGTLCRHLGIEHAEVDITATLEAIGCYRWRDEAIRSVFPEYTEGWKSKIVIDQGLLERDRFNFFTIVVESPDGQTERKRLPQRAYLQIVAATNFKQRIRKTVEYFHADRLNYAVTGTPNRLEFDQGFFVKNGDGSADLKPIAHLYKSQVYALAHHLGLPEEILGARPTTDTYSLPQSQDEFYFVLPYEKMDIVLYGLNHGKSPEEVGAEIGMTPEQVRRVFRDIAIKRRTTQPQHWLPLLLGEVPEIRRGNGNQR